MAPFQPAGERARWRIVYDLLCEAAIGDVVTYEVLGEALEMDPGKDRHVIQMAVRRAAQEHERNDKRALDVVPNEGYRIVPAPENLRLARRHQKKAGKSLARGQSKVVNVDLTGVDADTRNAFEVVARAFALQMDFNRRFDVRQARLEDTVAGMSERTERTEQEIADLKSRLAALEEGEQAP
jgi:hypothetical protein